VTPPPVQTIEELRRENEGLKYQMSTFHGKYGSTVDQLRTENAQLKREVATARAAQAAPQPAADPSTVQPATPVPAPVDDEAARQEYLDSIPQEKRNRCGDEFYLELWSATRRLGDATPTHDVSAEALAEIKTLQRRIDTDRFWDAAERLAPGAAAINGDKARGLPCADGWGAFLDEPVRPGSRITRRHEAEEAVGAQDAAAFAELVREFQGRQAPGQSTIPRPSIESQAVPHSVKGVPPPAANNRGRMIPKSEIDAWHEKCNKSQPGEISIEELDRKTEEHRKAYAEKRVLLTA
jgi:hypothetical protein